MCDLCKTHILFSYTGCFIKETIFSVHCKTLGQWQPGKFISIEYWEVDVLKDLVTCLFWYMLQSLVEWFLMAFSSCAVDQNVNQSQWLQRCGTDFWSQFPTLGHEVPCSSAHSSALYNCWHLEEEGVFFILKLFEMKFVYENMDYWF